MPIRIAEQPWPSYGLVRLLGFATGLWPRRIGTRSTKSPGTGCGRMWSVS